MEEFQARTPVFVDTICINYKEVWETADAEMPRERAIARDGKLPVKDPFVSGTSEVQSQA